MFYGSIVVFIITVAKATASGTSRCGSDLYYDSVTERCDTCHTICDFAVLQDTVEMCQEKCSGFKTTSTIETSTPHDRAGRDSSTCSTDRGTIVILSISLIGVSVLLITLMAAVAVRETRRSRSYERYAGNNDPNTKHLVSRKNIARIPRRTSACYVT